MPLLVKTGLIFDGSCNFARFAAINPDEQSGPSKTSKIGSFVAIVTGF